MESFHYLCIDVISRLFGVLDQGPSNQTEQKLQLYNFQQKRNQDLFEQEG